MSTSIMKKPDYHIFDADNHYYEALDAFTRHLDPRDAPGLFEWCEINGRSYPVVGGKLDRSVTNPTFDPVAKPGALLEFYKGNLGTQDINDCFRDREPIPACYRDRDARITKMDELGVDQIWLFPTLGGIYEELIKDDPADVIKLFRAFNEWLIEDWGFSYKNRIFGSPYISLCDVDNAVRTLEWAIEKDARTVVMRAAAPTTATGQKSPGDPIFDPFWARVNEAGITVAVHAANTGYTYHGYIEGETFDAMMDNSMHNIWHFLHFDRPITDFLSAMLLDRIFEKFPNVRMVSVENGSNFLADFITKMGNIKGRLPGYFKQDPLETFRQHVWISPFGEDDLYSVVELIGAERVCFGSDWPHVEGLQAPLDYLDEVTELDKESQIKIMGENTRALNERRPI